MKSEMKQYLMHYQTAYGEYRMRAVNEDTVVLEQKSIANLGGILIAIERKESNFVLIKNAKLAKQLTKANR